LLVACVLHAPRLRRRQSIFGKDRQIPLSTGLLQLQGGVALSSTLTAVTDQNNNATQLNLANNLTQIAGTLQIKTDTALYFDVEDGSGNNRFTISREPNSQQVNLDFASNPTGSTTAVGAIRTYRDGVNLSEAMTFIEDGNPDRINDMINWFKLCKLAERIQRIKECQLKGYEITPLPLYQRLFERKLMVDKTEDELWEMSIAVEPQPE
jgi:hypothetical protein